MLHSVSLPCLQFPALCPYSDATYELCIKDTADGAVVYAEGPHVQRWSGGGAKVTRAIRNAGLHYKREYSVNISVQTLVGESFTAFEIGEIKVLWDGTKVPFCISHHDGRSTA